MSRGLDQYLANRLTNRRVFQVVTDSKLAEAVFTDRLGSAFEKKLADLFGKPKSWHVLWSAFHPPRDSISRQLDRIASDIVSRLKRDPGEK
jgi:hypothetical protein